MNKNKDAHVLSVSNRPDSISQSTIFLTLTWGNPHTQTRQLPAFLTLRMPLILIQPVHTLACCLNATNIRPTSVVSSIPVSTASTMQYLWRLLLNTFCTLTFNKYVSGSASWSSRTCFRAVGLSFTAWMHPSNLHWNPSSMMTSDTGLINTLMESIQCRHSSNVFTRLSFNQAKNSALFS